MKDFLVKSAKEIDSFDDFERDPIEKFPIRYKLYFGCLAIMFLNIVFSIQDLIKYLYITDEEIEQLKGKFLNVINLNGYRLH